MPPEQPVKVSLLAAFRARYVLHPVLFLIGGFGLLALIGGAGWYGVKNLGSSPAPGSAPLSGLNNGDTQQTTIDTGTKSGSTGTDKTPGSSNSPTKSSADTKKTTSSGSTVSNGSGTSGSSSNPPPPPPPPPPAAPTYDTETAYSAPAFTANRVVDVYSQSAFNTAWSGIQPGDLISVHGVTFSGEVTLANKNLAGWAEIHFDSATKFVGVSTVQNVPAVWINNDSYIRFYGGDISDSASGGQAGPGILVYDSSYITWWGFVSHDVGRDGLDIFSVNKANSNLDFKGEVYHWGLNLAWDPHAEKGTGLHGANLGDSNYGMQDSRIALYAHDGAAGAGVEAGGASSTDFFKNNTIYLWCQNLTMVALSQTGGNCLQFWGENVTGNVIKYLEAENLQGRPYETGGMYSGQSLASNTIVYGRAANTNLNQKINDSIPQNVLWDYQFGTIFEDISPTP